MLLSHSAGGVRRTLTLVRDIEDYITQRNLSPKPYTWNAKGEEILRKINSAREALAQTQAKQG
jgi:hypothetical protein